MMLRKRRRPILFVSDSSDDDLQPSKYKRSSSALNISNSHEPNGETQEESDMDNESNALHTPRKKRKSRRLHSSDEVNSTEDEEIVHVRHGPVRALSDYESGTNSDYSGSTIERSGGDSLQMGISIQVGDGASSEQPNVITTNSGIFVAENSEQSSNFSESSSSTSIINQRIRKRESNIGYSSDSSDSELPIAFMCRRRMNRRSNIIHSTDDEYDSTNIPNFGIYDTEDQTPDYQRESPAHYEVVRSHINVSERPENGNNSNSTLNIGTIRVGIRNNGDSSDDESSDRDSVIINRLRIVLSAFDGDSSSTDSEENFSVRNRARRSMAIPLIESDNSETETAVCANESNVTSQIDEKTAVPSSDLGHSIDSDSESEKCPICLVGFNEQEIGVPSTCEHCFCLVCIQEWAKNSNTCPVDRKKFNKLIVYDKAHGTVVRRIAVENPVRSLEGSVELWESVSAEIMFTVQQINADENYINSSSEEEVYDGEADEICEICNRGSSDLYSDMIECDDCNHAFHMACVHLDSIPVSSWYCRDCSLQ